MTRKSTTRIAELTVDVYEPQGKSNAQVLYCHGAWVGGWIWDSFAEHMADYGYTGYVPTWRGHYNSRPVSDLGRVSMFDYVEDALAVARATGCDVCIGESMGGLIAQKVAEGYPDLKALVLMNPAPPFRVPSNPTLVKKQFKYVGDLLFKKPNLPLEEDYRELILNNYPEDEAQEFYKKICAESGRALFEMSMGKVKVDTSRVRCPVYVVVGHMDVTLPVKVHRKVAQLYNARLAEYPTMSHHTFSEDGWEKVASDLLTWLEEKLPTTAS